MHWILRRIFDRLFVKSTLQAASELEAKMCLELGQTKAQLLRKAHELEQEKVPGFEEIAADLRAQASRIGSGDRVPAMDVVAVAAVLRGEDLRSPVQEDGTGCDEKDNRSAARPALPAPGGKKRGRPRKHTAEKPAGGTPAGESRHS